MSKIIVTIGVAGSGKSTWAAEYIKSNPDTVIVSRDSFRMMLFGYTEATLHEYYHNDISDSEKVISEYSDNMIRKALRMNMDVIIDNTHLQKSYIRHYYNFSTEIVLRFFDVDIDVIIERDKNRVKSVGDAVIQKQMKQFGKISTSTIVEEIANFNMNLSKTIDTCKALSFDIKKPNCIVVDIDGTVAHGVNRSHFDYKKVSSDVIDYNVAMVVQSFNGVYNPFIDVFFCTGRDGSLCDEDTKEWLTRNGFDYSRLYMRGAKDNRKDWIIKAEMWKDIQETHNIIAMIDDRQQVVEFARKLGYKVLHCDYGEY